jgi:hypothetical protein
LALVSVSAVAVIVAADVLFSRLAPPVQMREVEHGVRDFARENPETLVLGSSHARTLHVLGEELERRTDGARSLVAVPVENGKIEPYLWVLRHRLGPMIDARDAQERSVKSDLKRFMLITEWWDSCPMENGDPYWNIPARAWHFGDFLDSVLDEGVTGFNRNYLQNRLRRLLPGSALVYDRTQQALVQKTVRLLQGEPLSPTPEEVADKTGRWQRMVERGVACINSDEQLQALDEIADFVQSRGLEMTLLLFPRKPATLSDQAKRTTLAQFVSTIEAFAAPRNIRVVDLTWTSPMGDEHFMEDFDHINAVGNREFAAWALDHDLAFLLHEPGRASTAGTAGRGSAP